MRINGFPGMNRTSPVRFAVVGAGHIAQSAVLPAFEHAQRDCALSAIFSSDPVKRRRLAREYDVEHVLDYEDFEDACADDLFDAVYICLPNSMHFDCAMRAFENDLHVLCEKPLATTSQECREMIRAARRRDLRLMTAYRLHFEPANLEAIRLAHSGKIGDLRYYNASFSMQVNPGNIRLDASLGGGPLFDIGIYCINAARYIFRDEPTEVIAMAERGDDPRFAEINETVSAVLRFPGARLASFTCSFGAADAGYYHVVGTKGDICLDPAFEYQGRLGLWATIDGKTTHREFRRHDQFAPELVYFAQCVRDGTEPEPGGPEGMIDVRIIEAIGESLRTGRAIPLRGLPLDEFPDHRQVMRRPPVRKPTLVRVQQAHAD